MSPTPKNSVPRARVAIIGSGISGMASAWLLHKQHDITLFEQDARVGGHTHTVDVEVRGKSYAVDTGFIVFNHWMYPNFVRLLDKLGVASKPTDMSFGVCDEETGLEYSSADLSGWFAQRSRLLDPGQWRTLRDVLRFSKETKALLARGDVAWDVSLGDFLSGGGYSREFTERFIVPMGSAIWSAPLIALERDFPLPLFIEFFHNHGMLNLLHKPVWRVIEGGSRTYAEALVRPFQQRIRAATPVLELKRNPGHVQLRTNAGWEQFDQVVIATHSDQALRLLGDDASARERELLGAMRYQANQVVLHTDVSLLPKQRRAWAAWNYRVPRGAFQEPDTDRAAAPERRATLTYNMNHLMGLDADVTFCVTLNDTARIDRAQVLRSFSYDHPVYDQKSVAARGAYSDIAGFERRTHFAGAYWGYGFHEDGLKSALRVGEAFGCRL